jgi:hypothetical protein
VGASEGAGTPGTGRHAAALLSARADGTAWTAAAGDAPSEPAPAATASAGTASAGGLGAWDGSPVLPAPEARQLRSRIDRAGRLDTARMRLAAAEPLARPLVLASHFDGAVWAAAWQGVDLPARPPAGPGLAFAALFAAIGAGLALAGATLARLLAGPPQPPPRPGTSHD